ncbi:MAG: hypothetical protein HFH82_16505 [Lachnospiraceae bacterium]|nr:hypothetical protein [Lachnospiraceae bacterium]
MNVIGNKISAYENTQRTELRNNIRNCDSKRKRAGEEVFGEGLEPQLHTEEVTVQDVYERMCAEARTVPEATQTTWTDQELQTEQVKQETQTNETKKIIEMSVVTLSNGISFEFNDETGEVNCIDYNDKGSGKHILWSKVLSEEELAKCDNLFENYADMSGGYFVFRYESYLPDKNFWDRYLDGKIDLTTLNQKENGHNMFE